MVAHAVKPQGRRHAQAGFTLVEVMISILLAAVATSGVIGLYTAVTRSSSYSRHATEAAILAEDQMEKLRTQSVPTSTTTGTDSGLLDERGLANANGIYTRTWTVTPAGATADLYVRVSWNEDGVVRRVELRSKRMR